MEQFSKHNIISSIHGSSCSYIMNLLSGQADIIDGKSLGGFYSRRGDLSEYKQKGYLVDPGLETSAYRESYLKFLDARDSSEVQLFLVPWYACNFSCSYCYQEAYSGNNGIMTAEMVDSFFSYIDNEFKYKKKYLTLFGGEPLLPGELYRERLGRIIRAAAERKLELAVVTNGFYLSEYLDLLTKAEIREIQVTLDGPAEIHDIRRPLKSGGGTFGTIVKGVDESLARGLTVNLRVVADSENIPRLHELADFAAARGWSGNPLFKTQVGRNYELHTCQMNRKPLLDRLGFGRALYREMTEHPALLDFFRPSFALAKHLHEQGKLPEPLFDGCPGCKTEWAFDCSGSIFSCTATVGKEGEALGRFHPDVYREETAIAAWTERDVLSIPECGSCDVQLACGGGCGAVAKNNSGRLHSPDCRPVKELMGLGLSLYFEKELQAEEEPICPD